VLPWADSKLVLNLIRITRYRAAVDLLTEAGEHITRLRPPSLLSTTRLSERSMTAIYVLRCSSSLLYVETVEASTSTPATLHTSRHSSRDAMARDRAEMVDKPESRRSVLT